MIKRSSKKLVDRHSELKLTQFSTKYVLDNKIGEGMHSSVYKCYKISDIEKKQPYAVKVTRDDDEEKKIANRNEYKISKNLLHRNIVRSIELFENEIEGEMHLVMQYVEGIEVLD
jgi:serine/threonine protein kinase